MREFRVDASASDELHIHVREARLRFRMEKQRSVVLAEVFFAASRSGDMIALGAMLAADVSLHADGGGKRPAAPEPVFGFDAVMKTHECLATIYRNNASNLVRAGFVNGLPGFVTLEADGEFSTTALDIEEGKVATIYVVRNPDKLSICIRFSECPVERKESGRNHRREWHCLTAIPSLAGSATIWRML